MWVRLSEREDLRLRDMYERGGPWRGDSLRRRDIWEENAIKNDLLVEITYLIFKESFQISAFSVN